MHPHRSTIRLSYLDAIFFSIMIGWGESYFVPFALFNGVSVADSGLLSAWPMCLGAIGQFFLFRASGHGWHPRRWLGWLNSLQVLSLFAIALAGVMWRESDFFYALISIASVYWFCTFAAGPVWNIWITRILPGDIMSKFFADRLKLSQLSLFLSFTAGGLLLDAKFLEVSKVHVGLLVGAGLARAVSGYFIQRLPDVAIDTPELQPDLGTKENGETVSLKRFILFSFSLYGTVYIAAPFFTAFMLDYRKFSYSEFITITGTLVLTRFAFSNLIHRSLDHLGAKQVMFWGNLAVLVVPPLWLVSDSILYLCILQVLAGLGWGALDLGLNVYMVQNWPHHLRARVLSWFNLSMAVSLAVGANLGAGLIRNFGPDSYAVIFLVSAAGRLLPLWLVYHLEVGQPGLKPVLVRLFSLRPWGGVMARPVLFDKPRDSGSDD